MDRELFGVGLFGLFMGFASHGYAAYHHLPWFIHALLVPVWVQSLRMMALAVGWPPDKKQKD